MIAPGTPDFKRLYDRRADAESINLGIEDRLYWNRAHSVGALGGPFDLLCYARLGECDDKGQAPAPRNLRSGQRDGTWGPMIGPLGGQALMHEVPG